MEGDGEAWWCGGGWGREAVASSDLISSLSLILISLSSLTLTSHLSHMEDLISPSSSSPSPSLSPLISLWFFQKAAKEGKIDTCIFIWLSFSHSLHYSLLLHDAWAVLLFLLCPLP